MIMKGKYIEILQISFVFEVFKYVVYKLRWINCFITCTCTYKELVHYISLFSFHVTSECREGNVSLPWAPVGTLWRNMSRTFPYILCNITTIKISFFEKGIVLFLCFICISIDADITTSLIQQFWSKLWKYYEKNFIACWL